MGTGTEPGRTDLGPPQGARAGLLQGSVERVTWRDPVTGFAVLQVLPERGFGDPEAGALEGGPFRERVPAVGVAPAAGEGVRVRLHGRFGHHRTHGRRFEFELLEVLPPLDPAGLVRYLSSSSFEGIGEVLAKRIVEKLGPNALAVIRETPERLGEVPGLRRKVAEALAAKVRAEHGAQELFAFLLGIGLGPGQAEAVVRRYGGDAERRVRADPYVLARDVAGIGFHTADRAATKLGLDPAGIERRRALLLHLLGEAADEGHSCADADELREAAAQRVGGALAPAAFEEALLDLERTRDVVVEPLAAAGAGAEAAPGARRVYLPMLHACEAGLAASLARLLGAAREQAPRPLADDAALAAAERAAGLDLDPLQREAVLGLLSRPVALLTGGPGVGKTTIVRLVVDLAERAGARVLLASPTGRAAKRLAEAAGRPAATVHRLLGFEPGAGRFRHGRNQPLEAELVVVDEISMLDVVLAHHLAKAVAPPTRLVLVGDPDQLPSVSAGNVLADLLASGCVPAFRLTRIFRQEAESGIVRGAHAILAGQEPELSSGDDPRGDFFLFPVEEPAAAAERLVDVVTERIPRRFGLDWADDVQVLAPMYRGECGVDALNERLRERLAAQGGRAGAAAELGHAGRRFRVGDRVIHTRNDYEKEVFNGDMGRVVRVAADGGSLEVRFPERRVRYERSELSDLQPAFAITVHRAQGGEFPAVVAPLVLAHWVMLQRHLLYTAVTRAKRLVVLVGSRRALRVALENAEQRERRSGLAERLRRAAAAAPPS